MIPLKRQPVRFFLYGFLLVCLASPLCLADTGSAVPELPDKFPRLGDHRFTPNSMFGDPFIRTYVRNSLGIGQAMDLFTPVLEIGGETVLGLKGDVLNAILEFEYQQAIKDWVAFRAQVRILGRLGTGTQSLLSEGISTNMGFEFGWMFRLAEGEKTALSATANVWNNSVTIVDLLGFVDGVVEGTNQPLLSTVPVTRVGMGLRYGWAASRLVGFTFLGDTGMGESINRQQSDEWFLKFGASVDFDLKSTTKLPFGLVLAYMMDTFPEGGNDLADYLNNTTFRVAYTGTTDFLIGLDFSYGWYKPNDGGDAVKVASTLLNLRYYF